MRAIVALASASVAAPFFTRRARLASTADVPRASAAASTSTSATFAPNAAKVWAMPLPIVPAPTTATLSKKGCVIGLEPLDRERDRVAPAETERGHARPRVALRHRVEQRDEDPRPRR